MGCGVSSTARITSEKPAAIGEKESGGDEGSISITKASFDEYDIKILLIGAGESGKSTLVKQIKRLYCGGFTPYERNIFKEVINMSIVSDFQTLVNAMIESTYKFSRDIEPAVHTVKELDQSEIFDSSIAELILQIWDDQTMKMVYSESKSLGIAENFEYFIDKINDFAEPDYLPSDLDILKARIRSIGRSDMKLLINDIKTKIVDIGGQKSERKHWEKCFRNLNYIIFVQPLSDFDQVLFEDGETSRTKDSLQLFENIFNNTALKNLPIFVIFNKKDIFEEKLESSWDAFLKSYPGYDGEKANLEQCYNHVKNTFLKLIPSDRNYWTDSVFTCAMDDVSVSGAIDILAQHCINDRKRKN